MLSPDPTLFSAEIRPAQDEVRPTIGPNLAADSELCRAVAQYISTEFFYPYWLQQQRYYPIWDRIDSMWRCTTNWGDLDVGMVQRQTGANDNQAQAGGFGMQSPMVPWQAKVTPAAVHKQIDAITTLGCALSFEGGSLPYQARRPKTVYENPLYNPVEQAVNAANEIFRRQAEEQDLKTRYRIGFANFVKYGFSFALRDFTRELETIECRHPLPPDPYAVSNALLQLRQYYGYPEAGYDADEMGRQVVVFYKTVAKNIRTNYIPLDVSSVFIDDLIPCYPMERQPCPIVKTFISRWELQGNAYDAAVAPFGWLNIDTAIKEDSNQYVLSQAEEQELRNRLLKRWGMNSLPGAIKPANTIQSLWTCYPMLCIEDGKLVTDKTAKCERYVVQLFGDIYTGGGVTCLRIQRNPTAKDKVPILFASHLVEDTATARPVSKSEIAWCAHQQLATAHNQFLDAKSRTINRGWVKKIDSLAYNINCNQPGVTIPVESSMENEVKRVESNNFDETDTLLPYMQMGEKEVVDIFGANATVVGEISAGRRPASEITLADEGSKRPLIQQIDQFNDGHMGGLGQAQIDDIETFMDANWMLRNVGARFFGKMQIHTAVGEDMLAAQAAIGQYRYLMEAGNMNPIIMGAMPKIVGKMTEAMKLDISFDEFDQGFRKSQQDAFKILNALLSEGNPAAVFPGPDDPDEIYLGVLKGCFDEILRAQQTGEENYWLARSSQNLPLLGERINLQMQQLQQKQMAAQQAAIQEQLLQGAIQNEINPPDARGNQPKRAGKPAATKGQQAQQTMGRNTPQ